MLKHIHLLFVVLAVASFPVRLAAAEYKPELLQEKWLKIAPHALATLLLLSGIGLVFQGNWLQSDYGWIVAKIFGLLGYIGLGIVAMRSQGTRRWQATGGAFLCLIYIFIAAISKKIFIFF